MPQLSLKEEYGQNLSLTKCLVNLEVGEARWEEGRVERLTTREVALLRYLVSRLGEDVSSEELHQEVWGHGPHTISRAASDTVRRLRPKIEEDPKQPKHLLTVYGEGFRLVAQRVSAKLELIPSKIPAECVPLFGREEELARALDGLQTSRLVTLAGPGGVGKTRLALRVAHTVGAEGFVDASSARTLDALREQISIQLQLRDPANVDELAGRLSAFSGLIVLDNLEQVAQPAAEILTVLLQQEGTYQILVTARARLGLAGERVVQLAPLLEPHSTQLLQHHLSMVGGAEVEPDKLNQLQASVEGMPLALELAAARVARLGVDRVLQRLQQNLVGLKAFRREGPERHHSVMNVVQWSWDLLDPVEKMVLAQAAVFRGGISIGALEAALGDRMPADRDLDGCVADLVEHALMRVGRPGQVRMYVSVRQVAESYLEDPGAAHAAHTRGVLAVCGASQWWNHLRIKEDSKSFSALLGEEENLSAVLDRVRHQEPSLWCQTVLYLSILWERAAITRRAVEELRAALQVAKGTEYEPHLLLALSNPLHVLGESDNARQVLFDAEHKFQPDRDRFGLICCHLYKAQAATFFEDNAGVRQALEAAGDLSEGEPLIEAMVSYHEGACALRMGRFKEALEIVRRIPRETLDPRIRVNLKGLELNALHKMGSELATPARYRALLKSEVLSEDVEAQAAFLEWLGQAEKRVGNMKAAAKAFETAADIYRRGGVSRRVAYLEKIGASVLS